MTLIVQSFKCTSITNIARTINGSWKFHILNLYNKYRPRDVMKNHIPELSVLVVQLLMMRIAVAVNFG